MKPVVIVKTGEPSPAVMERLGTFEEWILRDMALDQGNAEVVTVFHGAELPPPNSMPLSTTSYALARTDRGSDSSLSRSSSRGAVNGWCVLYHLRSASLYSNS